MKRIVLVLFFAFCGSEAVGGDPSTVHISKEPITTIELEILKHGDYYSIDIVLGRIQILFKEQGIGSVRVAIPILNKILAKLQTVKGDNFVELEGSIVAFLGKIGDASSMPNFLKAIQRDKGNTSLGLVKLGPVAVDSVITYLQDQQLRIRSKASRALVRMYRLNSSLFTQAHKTAIRNKLVENLGRYEYKGTDCFALATFGDATVIPILTRIVATDTLQSFPNKYPNRRFAQYAIDKIQGR